MALDDSAKESNIRDSIKRYLVDGLFKTDGVHLSFDKYLSTPNVQGKSVDRWVSVNFKEMNLSDLSNLILAIMPCTRSDGEGFKLAQLRDKVFNYLTDNTQTDGMARFALYRSRASGAWTQLPGGFIVQEVMESGHFDGPDGTKYKILTARIRFASKV